MQIAEIEDPVETMIAQVAYRIKATVHRVSKYTPGQMVFVEDIFLRTEM